MSEQRESEPRERGLAILPRVTTTIDQVGQGGTKLRIRGLFGLWFFPLLNILYAFVERIVGRASQEGSIPRRLRILEIVRDEKGRILQIFEREAEG